MSRRRGKANTKNASDDNSVRGPNSALTQFLKEQGISAESIRQRWLKTKEAEKQGSPDESPSVKDEGEEVLEETVTPLTITEDSETESEVETNGQATRLKRLHYSDDSDEEEYELSENTRTVSTTPIPVVNKVEIETKIKRSKQQLQQRKRKKKRAAELLDRKTKRISTLQDICIGKISENISKLQNENQDSANDESLSSHIRTTLGGISLENLNKLARTLSKNRALDDHTLQLFLKTELRSLAFYDCSKISFEGYKLLAIFAPHLTELSLQMCGQLNNEALLYIADKLPNLTGLYLDGPFLINEDTWNLFFEKMGNRLTGFHVSNTHRFNDESLTSLLRNCGQSLISLKLSRLDAVSDYSPLPQYLKSPHFETLCLQYPHKENDITDEILINILSQVGTTLKKLNLNGCSGLTDAMLIDGLAAFLSQGSTSPLEVLEMEELNQITNDGLVFCLSTIQLPKLVTCDFRRCLQIGDMGISELFLNEASKSLTTLNLNSMKALTKECFKVMYCPNLERLDVGFVRCVDDEVVKAISYQNEKLKILEIFGDNLVTGKAYVRPDVTIIGRQSDSI